MFLLSFIASVKAQTEIARMDYSVIADLGGNTVSDLDVAFRQQLWKGKHELALEADYQNREFNFFDGLDLSSLMDLNRIHTLGVSLCYEKQLGTSYALKANVNPVVSTTWGKALNGDDFYFLFQTTFSKTWQQVDKTQSIAIGLSRNVIFGEPEILPVLSFTMSWNNQWLATLGFPESRLDFNWNERNTVSLKGSFEGNYSHVSSPWSLNGQSIDATSFLVLNGKQLGLEHKYRLQPNFTTSLSAGWQFVDEFEITDSDETTLYDFGSDSSLHFSLGIQYNFK